MNNLPMEINNLPTVIQENRCLDGKELIAYVQTINMVKKHIMKRGAHFGKLFESGKEIENGCDFKVGDVLFKSGADLLCMTFRIAPEYEIINQNINDDVVSYLIRCKCSHQNTSTFLGEGLGEASSNEEKYKWREAVCMDEYNDTAENKRRIKYKWVECYKDKALLIKFDKLPDDRKEEYEKVYNGKTYTNKRILDKVYQIKTEPADIANTILKMAKKRAYVDAVIQVTASSGLWSQDLEDLPEELAKSFFKEENTYHVQPKPKPTKPPVNEPKSVDDEEPISEGQIKSLVDTANKYGVDDTALYDHVCEVYGVGTFNELTKDSYPEILNWIKKTGSQPKTEAQTEKPQDKPKFEKLQGCISEAQAKRLFAITKEHSKDRNAIQSILGEYGIEHINEIPFGKYNEIIEAIQQ